MVAYFFAACLSFGLAGFLAETLAFRFGFAVPLAFFGATVISTTNSALPLTVRFGLAAGFSAIDSAARSSASDTRTSHWHRGQCSM